MAAIFDRTSFYIGALLGASFCKKYHLHLDWKSLGKSSLEQAKVSITYKNITKNIGLVYVLLLFSVFLELFIFLIGSSLHIENVIPIELYSVHGIMFLGLVFIATFIMEILLVVILNRIGVEEQYSTNKNMIMRSYSLMAISAVITFWMMETFSNILVDFTSIILICFIVMHLLLNKRKLAA